MSGLECSVRLVTARHLGEPLKWNVVTDAPASLAVYQMEAATLYGIEPSDVVIETIDATGVDLGAVRAAIAALPDPPLWSAYDAAQPKLIDTREWFRRWTPQERARLRAVARNNDAVADLYEETIAGATVNLNDQRVIDGLQQLKAVMVPSVWADAAAADARIAELRA